MSPQVSSLMHPQIKRLKAEGLVPVSLVDLIWSVVGPFLLKAESAVAWDVLAITIVEGYRSGGIGGVLTALVAKAAAIVPGNRIEEELFVSVVGAALAIWQHVHGPTPAR